MKAGGYEAGRMPHRRVGRPREQLDEASLIAGSTVKTLMSVTSFASFEMVVIVIHGSFFWERCAAPQLMS
jgi:hypothetical protein